MYTVRASIIEPQTRNALMDGCIGALINVEMDDERQHRIINALRTACSNSEAREGQFAGISG